MDLFNLKYKQVAVIRGWNLKRLMEIICGGAKLLVKKGSFLTKFLWARHCCWFLHRTTVDKFCIHYQTIPQFFATALTWSRDKLWVVVNYLHINPLFFLHCSHYVTPQLWQRSCVIVCGTRFFFFLNYILFLVILIIPMCFDNFD